VIPVRADKYRYGHTAGAYAAAGWAGVLPLPFRAKHAPPLGWTGRGAPYPDAEQVEQWRRDQPNGNLALRMPPTVVGIDVDAYKPEARISLAALEAECGPLPQTWVSTSRSDGSGIRFYKVPERVRWAERRAGPGIELIHSGHRYAVAWPSTHPESRAYRWIGPDGVVADRIPRVDELPALPAVWGRRLSEPQAARATGVLRGPRPEVADKYAAAALRSAVDALAAMRPGQGRNGSLNRESYSLGGLVGAGLLDEQTVRTELLAAADANGHTEKHGQRQTLTTINSGMRAGAARPRTPAGATR
jgi:hypothetical protein